MPVSPAIPAQPAVSHALVLAMPEPKGYFGSEASSLIHTASAASWNLMIVAHWMEYGESPYIPHSQIMKALSSYRVFRDARLRWAEEDLVHATLARG